MSAHDEITVAQDLGDVVLVPGVVADGAAEDPVLANLARAEAHYQAVRAAWARDAAEVQRAREEAAEAREARRHAAEEAHRLRGLLDKERQRAARHKDRAQRLAAALKDVHRALFGGNVYDLILQACLTLTGATRGLYLTTGPGGGHRVRAARDVRGYPKKPPSEFVRALADRALADHRTFIANDPVDLRGLPAPADPDEEFRNCLAAPAVLLRQLNGVVVLADKPGPGFDDEDAELVMSVGDQAGVAVENRRLQDELLGAYFSVVGVLADAIEVKDPYTHGHCAQVARYARQIAVKLSETNDALRSVCCYGGLLHDVGKIGVSDGVLNKPGKLLPEEWVLMQSHARIGRDLLANVPALDGVADVVLHHHERYDGAGYPDGLRAEEISLPARIVAVADAYSAMTSKRSYKESMSPAEAREELIRCRGTHFDPAVVDALLAVLDDPEPEEDGPDGCELPPHMVHNDEFRHVLRVNGNGHG